jgi:hypothetical protein
VFRVRGRAISYFEAVAAKSLPGHLHPPAIDASPGGMKLPCMGGSRRVVCLVLPVAVVLSGCDRSANPGVVDSPASVARVESPSRSSLRSSAWPRELGVALLIPADSEGHAGVVFPDSAPTSAGIPLNGGATLVSRDGRVLPATIERVDLLGSSCWNAVLRFPPGTAGSFGMGVVGERAPEAVPIDSLPSLPRGDSLTIVRAVIALASVVTSESGSRFTGLPFVVSSLWRTKGTTVAPIVVAALRRQIPQEASPLQEQTFIVAERDSSTGQLSTAYSERSQGAEETIETRELLGALRFDGSRLMLIVARDYGDSAAFGVIERNERGHWVQRWRSAARRC